ncbi:MAG: hypothetical protein ACAI25_10120 [Planctomycetota bacterium]
MRIDNPEGGSDVRYFYYDYDRLNRLIHSIEPEATAGAGRGMQYFGFDAVSNRVLVLDQEGRPTYFGFDRIDREYYRYNFAVETWVTYFDARNSVTHRIDPVNRWTYFTFDRLNRLSKQSNMLNPPAYMGYDARSSRILTVNPRGFPTYWTMDRLARTQAQKDAFFNIRYWGYDQVGNRTVQVDERGGATYWAYDQADRVRMVMDAGDLTGVRGKTYHGWDAVGLTRMKTDADGRLTSFGYFGYDASRRPTTMSFSADPTIYYTYDSLGNLTSVLDETGTSTSAHDGLNRLTKKTTLAGNVYYAYDKTGLKTDLKDTDFKESTYVYDAAGRLQSVTLLDSPARAAYYAYDASGRLTKKAGISNVVLSYHTYDNAGRLSQLDHRKGSDFSLAISQAYVRDANGAITTIAREGTRSFYYTFDALGRPTEELDKTSGSTTIYGFRYNYDAASNRYFKYDTVNNKTFYYSFDSRNALRKEVKQ